MDHFIYYYMIRLLPLLFIIVFQGYGLSVEKIFYLMGTYSTIDLDNPDDIRRAYKYLRKLENKMSTYLAESEVSLINRYAGIKPVRVSEEVAEVIVEALKISEKTYGYFDITVGAYTINYRRKGLLEKKEALKLVNYKDVVVNGDKVFLKKKGMAIDLGGIGKGYALEKVYEYLNIERGFITIGGDMKIWGMKRSIAILDPLKESIIALFVNRGDLCISTSGNYHQDHIRTQNRNIIQVTVLYRNCTHADAYATALFAMPEDKIKKFLKENKDVGVFILYKDKKVYVNPAFFSYCEKFKKVE